MIRSVLGFLAINLLLSGFLAAQTSPFSRTTGSSSSPASTAPEEQRYQFTGVIVLEDAPLICVTDTNSNRSQWMKIGQTIAGVTLLRYSAEENQIAVTAGGRESTLAIKKRTFDPAKYQSVTPVITAAPLPTASLAERVPITAKEKETDARMLVSDLLEIGMIQRKAYEKAKADDAAKRKAAKNK